MTLLDEVKKYKYVGMPFHSPQWPWPVYSHLVVSNDGFNWINLKDYDLDWRDVDIHYINGLWWVLRTAEIYYSTDLETFNKISFDYKFHSVWAPELFQDKDGQWYLIYCGGDGTDNSWSIYVNKFYPDEKRLDDTVTKVNINEDEHWIDANLNYINGHYYLWLCCTSHDPHELRLYKSSSLLGPYKRVQTNINDRVREAGMVIDEAPEMLCRDGRYILYSDPYYHGLAELDRCVQYSVSKDMINWDSLSKVTCNGNYNPRHFTPLYIGDVNWENNDPNSKPPINAELSLILWDGNPGTLNKTNQDNFSSIQKLIDTINANAENNVLLDNYNVNFDTQLLELLNRDARNQFLCNANKLEKLMPLLMDNILPITGIVNYEFKKPVIPTALYFNQSLWNDYWQTVGDNLNLVVKAVNSMN